MVNQKKVAVVKDLVEKFTSSNATVITEYRGLTVTELLELRRSLGSEVEYKVAKNTLLRLAVEQVGVKGIDDTLNGPVAVAFIKDDVVAAAKALKEFSKNNENLVLKGGYLDGEPLTADKIETLARLESREVLLAKLAGVFKAGLSKAAVVFSAPNSKAARLFAALQDKKQQEVA